MTHGGPLRRFLAPGGPHGHADRQHQTEACNDSLFLIAFFFIWSKTRHVQFFRSHISLERIRL